MTPSIIRNWFHVTKHQCIKVMYNTKISWRYRFTEIPRPGKYIDVWLPLVLLNGRSQAITWMSELLGANFSEILNKKNSVQEIHLKISSPKASHFFRPQFHVCGLLNSGAIERFGSQCTCVMEISITYFWSKVNIWYVNCARATSVIFDTRTGVIVKVSKFLRQKISRPEGDSNPQPSDSCRML